MRFGAYIKDKMGWILLNGMGMLLLFAFLLAMGNSLSAIALIFLAWGVILAGGLIVQFQSRKKYFDRMESMIEEMDQPLLFAELMEPSWRLEDRLYRELLGRSNKAFLEEIRRKEDEQREYKEFIESWVHEAKNPITAMELLCENMEHEREQPQIRRMRLELSKVEGQVDKVLYYARMEQVWKDYLIARTDLRKLVLRAVQKNRLAFQDRKMQVKIEMESCFVSTDEKWAWFILDQIFSNCIKYSRDENGCVRIFSETGKNKVKLCVEDNGIGIRPEELGRVFEKGFCGTNGRSGRYSTGIGLYLTKKLCDRLGMGIRIESEYGQYTQVWLQFPESDFQKIGWEKTFQN